MQDPDVRALPELACAAVERVSGLGISLHDHQGLLWGYLPGGRFQHHRSPCTLVKRHRQEACRAFDYERLLVLAERHPGGLLKRCHAGIVEAALVVAVDGRPWLTLFAGPRRVGPGLAPEAVAAGAPGPWDAQVAALPALARAEGEAVLELLRQLAARLLAWRARILPADPGPAGRRPRGEEIRMWIQAHHREAVRLAGLAAHLGLSEDRASHAVVEACGDGFAALLARERLRSAAELLRASSLPVAAVALASGFRTRAHFHQAFRRAYGLSPAQWRRREA